jgi:hypothetical protein
MKKGIVLLCIGIFAMLCAGCITDDTGTTVTENPSAVSPQGEGLTGNAAENSILPAWDMNSTP